MKKFCLVLSGFFISSLLFFACGGMPYSNAGGPGKVLAPAGEADDQKVVTFYVIGKGLQPENAHSKGEAVLMAERAAVADGYRQLVEKLRGVYVDAFLRAGRGSVDMETIQVHTQSWLRGTEIMEITQGEYGITNARLSLRINFTRDGMIWWPVGIGRDVKPSFSEGPINNGGNS
jgi:outer membrane protein FlgP